MVQNLDSPFFNRASASVRCCLLEKLGFSAMSCEALNVDPNMGHFRYNLMYTMIHFQMWNIYIYLY